MGRARRFGLPAWSARWPTQTTLPLPPWRWTSNGLSIGIDIEPDVDLPDGLTEIVATPNELRRYHDGILRSRLLFVAKEAVYKATFPLDRRFLDFLDVEVDLDKRLARTRNGMNCQIFFARVADLAALAIVDAPRRDRN